MIKRDERERKSRVIEIDFIRGVLILFMIVDHIFYDFWGIMPNIFKDSSLIYSLKNIGLDYWNWNVRIIFRLVVLAMFFLISGISRYFSKNNLKRGLIVFIVGALMNLGFFIFGKTANDYMFFGAISCFGLSILIYWLLRFIFIKIRPNNKDDFKWIILSLGLMIVAFGITFNVWTLNGPTRVDKVTWNNFYKIMIGVYQHNGPDWLPLCPYLGLMFIGSFIGETLYKDKKSLLPKLPILKEDAGAFNKISYYGIIIPYKGIKNAVTFTGRHSLWFYLLHQVALILLIALILLAMGNKLEFNL